MAPLLATEDRIVLAPDERRRAVLDVIESARKRLRLSLFRCDDRRVVEALAAARRRGVRVEVLLTRRGDRSNLKLLRMLLECMGIEVCRFGDRHVKYHAKYVVADDGSAIIGSLNFTHKCFKKTSDFLLITHDPAVVTGLAALFDADCRAPFAQLPRGLTPRLIVGPERARVQIAQLIEQARRTIRIVDPKLSDDTMRAALERKAASGIAVEVLDRRTVHGFVSHGKLLIVDDSIAALGSLALSASNLDARREVAVIVSSPQSVAQLVEFFREAALYEPAGRADLVRAESAA